MSRPEEYIDQVLADLRDTKAPGGMEQRILRAVQERSSTGRLKSWNRFFSAKPVLPHRVGRPSILLPGLALVCLAVLVPTFAVRHHKPTRGALKVAATGLSSQPVLAPRNMHSMSPKPATYRTSRRGRPQDSPRPAPPSQQDLLAMEEMNAPSLPAPPLPLTAQERALSRIGQRRPPDAVAVLNDDLRARQQAEATTEFYDFFEPAKAPKSNN